MARLVAFLLRLVRIALLASEELGFDFHELTDVAVFVVPVFELVVVHGFEHLVDCHVFVFDVLEEQLDSVVHVLVHLLELVSLLNKLRGVMSWHWGALCSTRCLSGPLGVLLRLLLRISVPTPLGLRLF